MKSIKSGEKSGEKRGIRFATEKYQLMHFSYRRNRHNLEATESI